MIKDIYLIVKVGTKTTSNDHPGSLKVALPDLKNQIRMCEQEFWDATVKVKAVKRVSEKDMDRFRRFSE